MTTNIEKFKQYVDFASVDFRIKPHNIKFRKSTGISSASAYQFKLALGFLEAMDESDRESMLNDAKYGKYATELMKSSKVAKVATASVLGESKKRVIEMARPSIEEGKAQIRRRNTKYRSQVLADYTVARESDEFRQKYGKFIRSTRGGYFEMHGFWGSFIGRTLFNDCAFEEGIVKLCSAYEQGELDKIDKLFARIESRVPGILNVHSESIEGSYVFHLTLVTADNSYIVRTELILAGGYNIQVLHNRWLVKIMDRGTNKTQNFQI